MDEYRNKHSEIICSNIAETTRNPSIASLAIYLFLNIFRHEELLISQRCQWVLTSGTKNDNNKAWKGNHHGVAVAFSLGSGRWQCGRKCQSMSLKLSRVEGPPGTQIEGRVLKVMLPKSKTFWGICPGNSMGQKKFLFLKQRQVNSVPTMTGYSWRLSLHFTPQPYRWHCSFVIQHFIFSKEWPKNCLRNNFVYKSWDTLHYQHARTLIFWRCQLYHLFFLIVKYFRHQKWHVMYPSLSLRNKMLHIKFRSFCTTQDVIFFST